MGREGRFLALSVGLHAAVLVVAGGVALARIASQPPPAPPPETDSFEVELTKPTEPLHLPVVAPEPIEPAPAPEARAEDPEPPRPGETARVNPRESARPNPTDPREPAPTGTAQPSAPPSEFDPLPGDRSSVLTVPGIGGPPVWSIPGVLPEGHGPEAAPTAAPRAREVDPQIATKLLNEGLHDSDKAKGFELPAAGTAASAVQASLYGSDLPPDSKGTIAIRIGPNGQFLDAKVLSMVGGDAGQWERAAQAALARLRGNASQALPEAYKNGATLYIEAKSVNQLPAGGGSGISTKGATFDLSNVGAHKRQVVRVSTRVVPR